MSAQPSSDEQAISKVLAAHTPAEAVSAEATAVNETGNISTQTEPDPVAHITNADIDREWARQRQERSAPISKLGSFRGHESFRSLMRSLLKVGQQDKGKKTRAGNTFIGNDREVACELLGIPFQYEQSDYDDNDPHVIEAGTDSNAERRRETQGQAICAAVRTRLFHEEIQKQRPFHSVPTYEVLGEKFTGSVRSQRSLRNARKILDLCPELFACIERDFVNVSYATQLLANIDKTAWPEMVRILNDDRDPDEARQRRYGDERVALLQRAKQKAALNDLPKSPVGKKRKKGRGVRQDRSVPKNEEASPAGSNDASAPATAQDPQHDDPSDTGAADTGSGEIIGAALPVMPDALSRNGSLGEPAPKRQSEADDVTTDDLGVFTESLTALIHLQGLLRTYGATPALIEALETTLNDARESRQ